MKNLKPVIWTIITAAAGIGRVDSANAASQTYTCGVDSDVQIVFNVDWVSREGEAMLSGKALAEWLHPNMETVDLKCERQGGSSQRPWWTCSIDMADQKSIDVVFIDTTAPATAVVHLRDAGGSAVERSLRCGTIS